MPKLRQVTTGPKWKIPKITIWCHTSASASSFVAKAVCPSCQRNSRLLQSELIKHHAID